MVYYKRCVVPQCTNNSIETPQKVFVFVPIKRRKKWLQLAGRDPNSLAPRSKIFMCEDHFDLEKDAMNYMVLKMGFCRKIIWTETAVPKKFHCQEDHKKEPMDILEEYEQGSHPSCEQTIVSTSEGDVNMAQETIEHVAVTELNSTPVMDLLGLHVKIELDDVKLENEEVIIKEEINEMDFFAPPIASDEDYDQYGKQFEQHLQVHQEPAPSTIWKCTKRKYKSNGKNRVEQHRQSNKDETDGCEFRNECTYNAKTLSDLEQEEHYKCLRCDFESKYERSMIRHQLSHAEMIMFKCSQCNYGTNIRGNLRRHQLVHTDLSEIEMFKCSECDYENKCKGRLKYHLLMHADLSKMDLFRCSDCSYVGKTKTALRRHQVIHADPSKIELLKCFKCNFESRFKESLIRHQLVHADPTKLERFKCSKCNHLYKRKSCLRRHQSRCRFNKNIE